MKVLFELLLLVFWSVLCAADTVTSNAADYALGEAIAVTLATASTYKIIRISINGVPFAFLQDKYSGFTGSITFNGVVTCQMIAEAVAIGDLNIQVTGVDIITNNSTISNLTVNYNVSSGECGVYFVNPGGDPAQLHAASDIPITISTDTAFRESFITLNGQFFCDIGPVAVSGENATAGCSGFVPCFLSSNAQFALVAETVENIPIIYPGPLVQLAPNTFCIPNFGSEPQSAPGYLDPYSPMSTIEFTFQVNQNDNVAAYRNFEIWASNISFTSNVFVARVSGPLRIPTDAPFTYLITQWAIPCSFNNAGLTTFTLTYTQILSENESILRTQQFQIPIGSNTTCNLELVLNFPGINPLFHTPPSDFECPAEGNESCPIPCSNCSTCPSLAYQDIEAFIPGNTLNFFLHNGSISSVGGPRGIRANYEYYSSMDNFQYALSQNFFYYSNVTVPTGWLGYKPIGHVGPALVSIPGPPVSLRSISAFSSEGIDYLWGADSSGLLYCGTHESMRVASYTGAPVLLVAAGPAGLWLIDSSTGLFYAPSVICSDDLTFKFTGVSAVTLLTSSLSGAYIKSAGILYHLTAPSFIPIEVTMTKGPPSIAAISASNQDDSLAAIDQSNNAWILNSPTGLWTRTTLNNYNVINYNIDNLYCAARTTDKKQNVNHVVYGTLPFFNLPVYVDLSIIIKSILPDLDLHSATITPTFDACDNALFTSWTIPSSYKNAGSATAILSYTAAYPNGTSQHISSLVHFVIGPSTGNLLEPKDICPVSGSSKLSVISAPKYPVCAGG